MPEVWWAIDRIDALAALPQAIGQQQLGHPDVDAQHDRVQLDVLWPVDDPHVAEGVPEALLVEVGPLPGRQRLELAPGVLHLPRSAPRRARRGPCPGGSRSRRGRGGSSDRLLRPGRGRGAILDVRAHHRTIARPRRRRRYTGHPTTWPHRRAPRSPPRGSATRASEPASCVWRATAVCQTKDGVGVLTSTSRSAKISPRARDQPAAAAGVLAVACPRRGLIAGLVQGGRDGHLA